MNKRIGIYALIWAILLAAFNVICFVTPSEIGGMSKFEGAFWVGYIFITIAFIGQLVCACIALKTDDSRKLFYNIPLISISYTGLIITVIAGAICMAIPNLPNWVGIIVCMLVLVFTAIAVIKAKAASDVVERIDNKVKDQTFFIKSMTAQTEGLMANAPTPDIKAEAKKVYEAFRYSDPVSHESLAGVENRIADKFDEFAAAVTAGGDNIRSLAAELVELVGERNRKCKLAK